MSKLIKLCRYVEDATDEDGQDAGYRVEEFWIDADEIRSISPTLESPYPSGGYYCFVSAIGWKQLVMIHGSSDELAAIVNQGRGQ